MYKLEKKKVQIGIDKSRNWKRKQVALQNQQILSRISKFEEKINTFRAK